MKRNNQEHIAIDPKQRSKDDLSSLVCNLAHNVPHEHLSTMSTAPDGHNQVQYCTIVHSFHPLYSKKIQIVSLKQNWGEDRVFYRQEDGRITSIPACWTSIYEPHPFNVISKGRSVFRFQELLELTRLIEDFMSEGK